ncbi:uncharacterized protein LOC142624960 [Castanea sativa]|uniref:uncharacterized protein LOC142624960 n=1 Tax=Castanea sativa TaxID=21020 RepID=UPI003F64E251
MVEGLFNEEEAEIIKEIPLSRVAAEDTLYWPYSSNGLYNCKSRYKYLKMEEDMMDRTHESVNTGDTQVWKQIWSMSVPQKVKTLLWRACREAMPTKHALFRRKITEEDLCVRCRVATDYSLHALWSCSELDVVWAEQELWSFRGEVQFEKKSGIGVVIRDNRGLVIASCSKVVHQMLGCSDIEAMAAAWALNFASDVGVRRAVLEGDSMAVITGLREDEKVLVPYGLLLEDAKFFSQQFDELLYSHTKRKGNNLAHSLTRYAIGIPDFLVWMEDVPSQLYSVFQTDLSDFY